MKPIDTITPRERQIIDLVCLGYSHIEISNRLGIGYQTVKNHFRSIYNKTGMSNKYELVSQQLRLNGAR